MLKIESFVTNSPEQWEIIIRGMRNPMNSWDRMDSVSTEGIEEPAVFELGPNDHKLAMQLSENGPVHAKYRRMLDVIVEITAPLYWWKEFDTYKVGTVCNSCSTMHKIHAKEFTWDDFSFNKIFGSSVLVSDRIIKELNYWRDMYINGYNLEGEMSIPPRDKDVWWQMIQLLPSSYNQKRTVKISYEALANMYTWRKNHKLDCWRTFCNWIEELPYSEIITGDLSEEGIVDKLCEVGLPHAITSDEIGKMVKGE